MATQQRLEQITGIVALDHIYTAVQPGRATAGSLVLHGARVGDAVIGVPCLTTPFADALANYEATITVADHIVQGAIDNSAKQLMFILKRP